MATLTYSAITITFSDDMAWLDEFGWQAVEERREYSVTGALLIETARRLAGQPITLAGSETSGWMRRSTLIALAQAAAIPGQVFTLHFRGSVHTVAFAQSDRSIEATPVNDYSDPADIDYYVATLRFIKV